MKDKNPTKQPNICLWSFAVLSAALIVFIFLRSLQPAPDSNAESLALTGWLRGVFDPQGHFSLGDWNNAIRKAAHFIEFAVLGICVGGFTASLGGLLCKRFVTLPMLICLLTAAVDEGIQKFIPGRSSSGTDVLLDFCGAVCGIAVISLIFLRIHKKKRSC